MQAPDDVVEDALVRLRKVEGQVQGVIRMIEAGRDCREVVRQISAAGRALDQVGFRLVAAGLRTCAAEGEERAGVTVEELERLFVRIA